MKYNVGDRVRIKSLDWYNQMLSIPSKIVGKNDFVAIECGAHIFTKEMCKFCGRVMTIKDIGIDFYLMDEDVLGYEFTDEMIEGLAKDETKPKYEDEVNGEYYSTPKYLVRPSGYQFVDENGNVINAMKIVLEKKSPKTDDIIKY